MRATLTSNTIVSWTTNCRGQPMPWSEATSSALTLRLSCAASYVEFDLGDGTGVCGGEKYHDFGDLLEPIQADLAG